MSAEQQARIAYAIWEYGRSTRPRQQAAVMLYVHMLMGDGRPGELDPAALGRPVAVLYRRIAGARDALSRALTGSRLVSPTSSRSEGRRARRSVFSRPQAMRSATRGSHSRRRAPTCPRVRCGQMARASSWSRSLRPLSMFGSGLRPRGLRRAGRGSSCRRALRRAAMVSGWPHRPPRASPRPSRDMPNPS